MDAELDPCNFDHMKDDMIGAVNSVSRVIIYHVSIKLS